ncbi:MAG: hypothetical protein PHH28_03345 [Desulfuromonadaceae bacterium]|nr:hypothetical protein [Desulfuromonadaceae bacterium]
MVATPELLTALGLTLEQFNYLSGLSGLLCALMIGLIWNQGL